MAMTLEAGESRLGWFIDGLEETPEVSVTLENTGEELVLTLPTKGMFDLDFPYARWFAFGTHFGDDPDRTRYRYALPDTCLFYDGDGRAVLVGCWARSTRSNFQAGVGEIVADYVVLGGGNLNYAQLNGVRVDFPALIPWTRISSVRAEPHHDDAGRLQSVTVTADSPPTSALARRMNQALRPTFHTEYPD